MRPWLRIGVALVAGVLAAAGAAAAPGLTPGIYEGLWLAVSADGQLTGRYLEAQGQGVVKRCDFFLSGQLQGDQAELQTWSTRRLPGRIAAGKDSLTLTVPQGREHAGCGLVLLPQIDAGLPLDRVEATHWTELRRIAAPRAYFHAAVAAQRLRSFVVQGDVVGVLSQHGNWLQVDYRSPNGRKTLGWIKADETQPISATEPAR